VEALSRVSLQLNGVCGRSGNPTERCDQEGGGGESHVERAVPKYCSKGAIELNRISGQGGTEVVMMMAMLVVSQWIWTTRKVSIGDARTTLVNSPRRKRTITYAFNVFIFIFQPRFFVNIEFK
jgi:hypothetical protein